MDTVTSSNGDTIMVKLITATWSFEKQFNISTTPLYKSFIKHNDKNKLFHIHFDRNNYKQLELEFTNRFDTQSEYILYKIFLLKDIIKTINSDYIIFCDANDVVCLGNIDDVIKTDDYALMSAEANEWPSSRGDFGGLEYTAVELKNKQFLNSGLLLANKQIYFDLLNSMIDNILPTNIKSFGGDQGVFTYHYLAKNTPAIVLDKQNMLFLSTFSRHAEDFQNYKFPMFVHDNGWNWGSPRFIEKFELI